MLIFTKMAPFSYTWSKIAPLSYTSRISQNNRISCDRHILVGFSVLLAQLLKGSNPFSFALLFLPKFSSYNTLGFSHHLSHLAADFVTLSGMKMRIFPTLYILLA